MMTWQQIKAIPVVTALSLGLAATSVSTQVLAERNFVLATPVVVLMPHVMPNADLLELTPEQRQEARLIANQMNHEREDNEILTRSLRREMWELLSSSQAPDPDELQKLVKLISETEQARVAMSVECATRLRAVLNADQWDLLVELASDLQ
ncbi:hypothetical protein THIAE_03220 [Thiomicrospira aerophila AL3]|uniref:Periplasmic heavy metal sensor n=1 Tax=Thiomicrospira aerophila AL3 TaxID=717772 RepID=W0DQM5_9GAMM|nr:hypothetical protein [Thiomicrospira aerophila]AHF00920.1 hypothetical protein THIAE_03220 [Thiomicrospira aerophila AL3]